jgi:predicted metal-binding membrane protein
MKSATPLGTALETALRRDRLIVLAGIAGVALLAWVYLFYLAWDMQRGMDAGSISNGPMGLGLAASQVRHWGGLDFLLMFVMWAVMMTAMMTPTAAPMILTFATVNRQRRERKQPFVSSGVFLLGYVLIWSGFAAWATLAQGLLNSAALLTPMMASASPFLGGGLLLAAGLFQWSPIKYACLNHCRTPMGFVLTEWREGTGGALVMGLRHGTFCLGCCWALMSLLFVLGVMNLLWIAALAFFVLIEKVAPAGQWISRTTGLLLAAWGVWMVAGAWLGT